ncbi:MAG: alcohol dehydrogenase catalytic domain-containing protein [Actinomycetota bacterium]|nr:alcohol dehydrogenase catalytic domain-containing protein [Actinomycetota bacterium]
MRALVWHGDTRIDWESVPDPLLAEGEVVLEVELAGICGSDLHAYRGNPGPRSPPLILGHEAVGSVADREGRYTVFPLVTCGRCRMCLSERENLCEQRHLLGLDLPGVFASRVAVRADALLPVPNGLDPRIAVLVEPLAASLSAWRIDGISAGDSVLVVGGGPIGLLAVYLGAQRGARVACVEPVAERRALAERLGATQVLAATSEVGAGQADFAIDAVGVEATWRAAIKSVHSGGSVALVGLGQAEGAMPVADLVRRGVNVRGHYAYTRRDFGDALALLAQSPPPLDWLTVMDLAQGADGFRRLVEEPASVTKVLLATR